ncbi:hypothetical protein Acr_15g0004210 [Actinidia rufa]|uniref:NB-ARC domain-containing protein n=1 Tax=Actinidia rufa TaxID=165716 RepID=A0A7J0FSX1_9ERIC|nr:hypothetical protein Acr_15g0004210 [Actinidia rufa]
MRIPNGVSTANVGNVVEIESRGYLILRVRLVRWRLTANLINRCDIGDVRTSGSRGQHSRNLSLIGRSHQIKSGQDNSSGGSLQQANAGKKFDKIAMVVVSQTPNVTKILEEVANKLELEEVGIPFGEDHKCFKILLTSQSQAVCSEMGAQKTSPIQLFSELEAWVLFRNMVAADADSSV